MNTQTGILLLPRGYTEKHLYMNTIDTFNDVAYACSAATTERYSTSFASAIRLLHKDQRAPVHAIYGFVRLADEIVDTFHDFDKAALLADFKAQTYAAIAGGISLNPILQSFQHTVNKYHIDLALIEAFLHSMETDLHKSIYQQEQELCDYIYGSAEVVGLMCLYVFCEGDEATYQRLKPAACSLGAAFQKVNFLRDLQADHQQLHRTYFPGLDFYNFDKATKQRIESDIAADFSAAYNGIRQLPVKARFGVYVAFRYYLSLFHKIRRMQPSVIIEKRVRVPNFGKALILLRAGLVVQLRLI